VAWRAAGYPDRAMRRVGPVLVAAFALSSATARADAPPRNIDELRARIARVLLRERVPGAGIALVADGEVVWSGGVGMADREARRPVDADTLFRVASITKTFVALAVMKLVEEGRLELDARVADIAPEIEMQNAWAEDAPVTVAHLLEHTAGFDDMRPNEFYASVADEARPLAAVLARNPRSRRSRWRPGLHMSYANPGYTVAAYVIEKVAGEPYEDYLAREILRPLGMDGARLRWSAETDRRLARGHQDGVAIPFQAIVHRPAGNLMASPRELAALVTMWLARGRPLVSPASAARMERSETGVLRGLDVDYGLGVYGDVFQAVPMRGHDGGIDGFLSSYRYDQTTEVGYVVLLNSADQNAGRALFAIRELVLRFLLADRATPAPPQPTPVPDDRLAVWAGTYRIDNPRSELFSFLDSMGPRLLIRHEPGRLVARIQSGDWEMDLVPLGGDSFRLPRNSGRALAFTRDASGRRALHGVFGQLVEEPPVLAALAYHGSRAVLLILASALVVPFFRSPRRRHLAATCATLTLFAIPPVFFAAAEARAIGEPNLYTLAIAALTVAFTLFAGLTVKRALFYLTGPFALSTRLYATAFALAAGATTAFLAHHHLIGICLWRW
jgi:CubicO group peptidase (beta-lactamase class C family)